MEAGITDHVWTIEEMLDKVGLQKSEIHESPRGLFSVPSSSDPPIKQNGVSRCLLSQFRALERPANI